MSSRPIRRLSPQQARIAELIAHPRRLSYAEIGAQLQPPLSSATVRAYVRTMSLIFDSDSREAWPPRTMILLWVKHVEWQLGRLPSWQELQRASVPGLVAIES